MVRPLVPGHRGGFGGLLPLAHGCALNAAAVEKTPPHFPQYVFIRAGPYSVSGRLS